MNLADGLAKEIKRNIELLEQYKSIGPSGAFGHTAIKADIDNALNIQASGDVIEMCRIYETLKNNQ